MRICCISDTHNYKFPVDQMPAADLLIHAGDFTFRGRDNEIEEFNNWLGKVKFLYDEIIVIPGNHELGIEADPERTIAMITNAKLLINEEHVVKDKTTGELIKIFGSPVTPPFFDWAWNWNDEDRENLWESIPDDTNILITHGPPKYIMDEVFDMVTDEVRFTGCPFLAKRVAELRPNIHIFGHIHEQYGIETVEHLDSEEKTTFINAALLNDQYKPAHKPIVVEI